MFLAVHSLKKTLFEGEAVSLNCRTASGEITVLDNHRPLVSILKKGLLKILDQNQKEHYIPVSSGFIEVGQDNNVRLIAEEDNG